MTPWPGRGATLSRIGDRMPAMGLRLVSRFRSSHHYAARSLANFGIKGTLAIMILVRFFDLKFPTQARGYNDRNFKSTALVPTFPITGR